MIIEIKKYSHKVNISDLDEFQTKRNNFSHFSIKPIFVSSGGFTQMEYTTTKVRHIALVRYDGNSDWKWEMPRDTKGNKSEEYFSILRGLSAIGSTPLAEYDGFYYNFSELLHNFSITIKKYKTPKLQVLAKARTKEIANEYYLSFPNIDDDIPGNILSSSFPYFRISFSTLPHGEFGHTSILKRTIILDNSLLNDINRRQFTLAHELGHIYLHSELLSYYETNSVQPNSIDFRWMENQANWCAYYILMPGGRFVQEVRSVFLAHGLKLGKLYIDNQPGKGQICRSVLNCLSNIFHVSHAALKIRMTEEGLLIDTINQPQRISNIMNGY
ncbi:MAG: ImmA/IrrE family metallo-endopeptidase [Muribaculaceae bacterium]|nr:ImmA/IrrE family metallo-endopeptidase [Muribaculaceae bacterium]